MKILSLNAWGGRVRPELYEFLTRYAGKVDVFCLQEVYNDPQGKSIEKFSDHRPHDLCMLDSIREVLYEYHILFAPLMHEIYGIALCIKKSSSRFIYSEYQVGWPDVWLPFQRLTGDHARKIQVLQINGLSIINFHGIWTPLNSKRDCPERDAQTDIILSILGTLNTPSILIGDYNLRHDTESFARLSEGRRDLISEYAIASTRTPLYQKTEYLFADYALVDPVLEVGSFEVLEDIVSDHRPLLLDIVGY